MSKDNSLSINIMDKDYRVACPPEEQASLRASAEFLNEKLNEIRNRGSVIGTERIAIMAALNLAHELLNCQEFEDGLMTRFSCGKSSEKNRYSSA